MRGRAGFPIDATGPLPPPQDVNAGEPVSNITPPPPSSSDFSANALPGPDAMLGIGGAPPGFSPLDLSGFPGLDTSAPFPSLDSTAPFPSSDSLPIGGSVASPSSSSISNTDIFNASPVDPFPFNTAGTVFSDTGSIGIIPTDTGSVPSEPIPDPAIATQVPVPQDVFQPGPTDVLQNPTEGIPIQDAPIPQLPSQVATDNNKGGKKKKRGQQMMMAVLDLTNANNENLSAMIKALQNLVKKPV
ncbi:leucine-rich repeat extensin-like protein 5, partial [Mizuhopecten yessoensis]|uniref:leucine-rich repeat extensin-like protein 5 n=1 Tax=Mizuhopecten yessoensis TaxID=6573 RepID=UPI000B45D6D3